jgi:uncharacterized protein YjbI with pentapeptide repeats
MRSGRTAFFLVLLSSGPACLTTAVGDDDQGLEDDLTNLDGRSLNGRSLNGVSLNGRSLNGVSLNGVTLNGRSLNGVSLNGSQLTGIDADGHPVSGTALVGARFNGELGGGGGTLLIRVDSATTLPAPNADVWAYGLSYAVSNTTWSPLCDGGAPVLAVPLSGIWNYQSGVSGGGSWTASTTSFTLGCRGAALAKCVELGYKPWKTVSGTLLRNHHQACARMIRADYCGDGMAWTADGTMINLYDNLGIQLDTEDWKIDGEWLPSGARCIDKLRDFQDGKPSCWELKKGDCGTFANGALLISEYNKHI